VSALEQSLVLWECAVTTAWQAALIRRQSEGLRQQALSLRMESNLNRQARRSRPALGASTAVQQPGPPHRVAAA